MWPFRRHTTQQKVLISKIEEIEALIVRVQRLDPCPTPDCARERQAILDLTQDVKERHRAGNA